jgi:hypothetical protein
VGILGHAVHLGIDVVPDEVTHEPEAIHDGPDRLVQVAGILRADDRVDVAGHFQAPDSLEGLLQVFEGFFIRGQIGLHVRPEAVDRQVHVLQPGLQKLLQHSRLGGFLAVGDHAHVHSLLPGPTDDAGQLRMQGGLAAGENHPGVAGLLEPGHLPERLVDRESPLILRIGAEQAVLIAHPGDLDVA